MSFCSGLRQLTLPMVISGMVAVLVGYTSSAAIIFQAASAAGASTALTGSWLGMLGFAMGITSLWLSVRYRMPVLTAWSTPGAAMLATSLSGASLAQTIGIFIFTNLLIMICGITGIFARLMRFIPVSNASGMLAGILLHFGLQAFSGLSQNLPLCLSMCVCYLLAKRLQPRYAVFYTLLAGLLVILWQGNSALSDVHWQWSAPVFIAPQFDWQLLLGVGIPYFLVSMASQNARYCHPSGPRLSGARFTGHDRYRGRGIAIITVRRFFCVYCGNYGCNLYGRRRRSARRKTLDGRGNGWRVLYTHRHFRGDYCPVTQRSAAGVYSYHCRAGITDDLVGQSATQSGTAAAP